MAAGSTSEYDQQMKTMQDMHQKMVAAKTPEERAALMKDHMRTMQDGMAMMGADARRHAHGRRHDDAAHEHDGNDDADDDGPARHDDAAGPVAVTA